MTMRLVKNSILRTVLTVAGSLTCFAPCSAFGQSSAYTWALKCSPATLGVGVGTGATWLWLHDGVQISYNTPPNGYTSCVTPPLSGSGEIPANINGVQVNGIEVDLSVSAFPAGCQAFASVRKSFDPLNPKISIKDNVSVPSTVDIFGTKESCPKASFSFSLNN